MTSIIRPTSGPTIISDSGTQPHRIDNQGRYRRFILEQVTLNALLSRVEQPGELAADELLFEAAAVLCGTMLMASGTSGSGPDAYDSTLSLAMLAHGLRPTATYFTGSFWNA